MLAPLEEEVPRWPEERLLAALEADGQACSQALRQAIDAELRRRRPRAGLSGWPDDLVLEALIEGPARRTPGRWLELRTEAAVRGLRSPDGRPALARARDALWAHLPAWALAAPGAVLVLALSWLLGIAAGDALGEWAGALPRAAETLRWTCPGTCAGLAACLVLPVLLGLTLPACAGERLSPRRALAALRQAPAALLGLVLLPLPALVALGAGQVPFLVVDAALHSRGSPLTSALRDLVVGAVSLLGLLASTLAVVAGLAVAALGVALAVRHDLPPLAAQAAALDVARRRPRAIGAIALATVMVGLVVGGAALLEQALARPAHPAGPYAPFPAAELARVVGPCMAATLLFALSAVWTGLAPAAQGPRAPVWSTPQAFGGRARSGRSLRLAGTALLLLAASAPAAGASVLAARLLPGLEGASARAGGLGLYAVGLLGGLVLLRLDHVRARRVVLDRLGARLDVVPGWPGTLLPWWRVSGFLLESEGARLVVRGRPWTRWVGPLVPAQEAEASRLVALLEGLGVPRL